MSLKLKIGTFLLSFALGIGGVAAISYAAGINYGGPAIQQESDGSGLDTEVEHAEGMKLKLLSTETRANGDTVQTFSYTITPANATNQNINVAVNYATGGAATEVTASVNTGAKTITITCKQAFDKVINVVLTAADGGGATATIKCDYQKRVTGLKDDGFTLDLTNYSDPLNLMELLVDNNQLTYSAYTMDYDYSNASITDADASTLDMSYFSGEFRTKIQNFFAGTGDAPTASEVWNASTNSTYRSQLKTNGGLLFDKSSTVDYYFTIQGDISSYDVTFEGTNVILLKYNFSSFSLNIETINPGQSSVIF